MKIPLLLLLGICLLIHSGCSSLESQAKVGNILPPVIPQARIPAINDPYWLNQTNWPSGLTNNGLAYNLTIRIKDKNDTPVTSFIATQASNKRYSACYLLDGSRLTGETKRLFTDASQVFYGPDFEWLPDGRLRGKHFHYGNGFKEHHWLDAQGKPVWSDYTDSDSNRYWNFRFDANGKTRMSGTGRDDPSRTFRGENRFLIDGQPVKTEEEFLQLVHTYRRNEIIGNE